ncbi:MAG: DISARM system SNF2-like helicase DrmD [Sandaracinaceae bacterium]
MSDLSSQTERASVGSVLGALTIARIREVARDAGLAPRGANKHELVESVERTRRLSFRRLLGQMHRDELRRACREHGLDDTGRARQSLMQRLLELHGAHDSAPPPPLFTGTAPTRNIPSVGDTVIARHRQWLVDDVQLPENEGDATLLALTCLDDDNRGQTLSLLWELELGARVVRPEASPLAHVDRLDPPRHFAAYLHALRWQSVTAADKDFFQSPFRAGIEVLDHQLTPLAKALSLPRANLFIADDVGLGKTIEAGLVLQELLLRQRVEMALIVCPASVTLQWQREMDQRFGLRFEVYSRDFILARRRERGFAINPWDTHSRFIISYPLLRRPEYLEGLLTRLGKLGEGSTRAKKTLLILDEAHTAAPASAGRYAVDSQTTKVIRDIAPRFENRLFLSATPHNGHSNSFSALLEILDPQRFARGVPVRGKEDLAPIMVRRLKRDLRDLGKSMRFPERRIVRVRLAREADDSNATWTASFGEDATSTWSASCPDELDLAKDLAAYTAVFRDLPKTKRLPLINLQKRLLSSVEAFARTVRVHAQSKQHAAASMRDDDEVDAEAELGLDDDAMGEREDARVESASAAMRAVMPDGAAAILSRMQAQAERLRHRPCAKTEALLAWVRTHQCASLGRSRATWTPTRAIVFTEYADTLRFLVRVLSDAIGDEADDRILTLHGGMSEEHREEVQFAFNAEPDDDPVRILLCTDAAREGLNLQAHCADLFHFDIPWNPSRLEQRNGRIDRALQPAAEVRCHYFVYDERPEDRVLEKVVRKTEIIHRELGSLGDVVAERIVRTLDPGIDDTTDEQLEIASDLGDAQRTSDAELEDLRQRDILEREMESARRVYEKSRRRLRFQPEHLRDALDVGLELSGGGALEESADIADQYRLPDLGREWADTLDGLRPPRGRDEAFYDWRKKPPRPVVFRAPKVLTQAAVHLHLEHPFVQRVLSRFLAQGFSSHDLRRVTAVAVEGGDHLVLALGRLCLFGSGAGRLHDTLLSVAARVTKDGLDIFDDRDSASVLERLETLFERERPTLDRFGHPTQLALRQRAERDLALLVPALREEADAEAVRVEQQLAQRAQEEEGQLRRLLTTQRRAIDDALGGTQLKLDLGRSGYGAELDRLAAQQLERDRQHLHRRLELLDREIEHEPAELAALYRVLLRRFEPIGLVYLYPEMSL